jgi:hypothetical protein
VRGLEATWVQSLDFLLGDAGLDGFGFSINGTYLDQDGSGAAPAVALEIPRYAYNATFYYENHGIMARILDQLERGLPVRQRGPERDRGRGAVRRRL